MSFDTRKTAKRWAYEDFAVGAVLPLGEKLVSAEEIVNFAEKFDPQPMHLDEAAGKRSLLGGLAASGWHVCAIFMRMMCDAYLVDSTSQGAPGIDQVRWKRPVQAGDRLTGQSTVTAKRLSKSRAGLGLISFRHEFLNQRDESVFEMENVAMFLLRDPS